MYALIFILFCSYGIVVKAQEGFFCVPVADLVALPFVGTKKDIKNSYNSLSISPEQGKESCLRVRQALFNEQVTIVDYKDDQVQVILKNCFYKSMMSFHNQPVKVWTLKDWVITIDEINDRALETSIFPPAYGTLFDQEDSVIALTFPWYDAITGLTYSVGTRFYLIEEHSTDDYFCIALYDTQEKCSAISYVPRYCALNSAHLSDSERRKQFIQLLYRWCNHEGSIPYVWGGASFIQRNDLNIVLKKMMTNGLLAWSPDSDLLQPLCGLDCSGLILRAAQICGIKYFCCNSSTVANTLALVTDYRVQEGDILWAPGYLGVIALENNEIIEAQGYARGYGKVHCLPLNQRFQGIETWNDLIACCKNNIPLKSLDSQRRCVAHIPLIKIFHLPC